MTNLVISDTGVDDLYEDQLVPIAEISIDIATVRQYVARKTSLSAQTDPFFTRHSEAQKSLVELHGEANRIFKDYLDLGAEEILPIFQPYQRWMPYFLDEDGETVVMFENNTVANPGKIIYRYQIMDTRMPTEKQNYTSQVFGNIVVDHNNIRNAKRYLTEALRDYILREFYGDIGHERKIMEYKRAYELSRGYVAFWVKSDFSLRTSKNSA